ncbi:MAG: hybrid sensor histidine kinase/response regulator [Janthinobacterium lividum]
MSNETPAPAPSTVTAALFASQERFRTLVMATSAIVWSSAASGLFVIHQEGWAAFTGQGNPQHFPASWLEAVHPEDRQAAATAWDQARAIRSIYIGQHRVLRADGQYRHMTVKAVPILETGGNVIEWIGAHTDITGEVEIASERERLLRELRAANDRMADIFRQAPAFMCVLSGPEHVFEMVNDRYLQLVGNRDLVGLPVHQALPEIEGQGFEELLNSVYHTGAPYFGFDMALTLQRQPGMAPEERYVDFVYMPLRDANSEITGLLVHGVDQTHRKMAELEIRRTATVLLASEERYRTLFESMDQGFCVIDILFDTQGKPADYRFIQMNRMFETHTGITDGIGKTVKELIPALSYFWIETYGRVAQTGEAVRFESEASAMGRWFDVYATRIGAQGSSKVALLFTDITGRKASEEKLRKLADDLAETDTRKTEFLATLAHELRNPLAPIRSGLSVMRMKGDSAAAVGTVRAMMERQVDNMVHLIDDLLDIARISGGKMELKKSRADLTSVLASAIETSMPLIEGGKHALSVELPHEPLLADVDVTRIVQVVANLLNNAAKYTPSGGQIRLTARREGDQAVIAVSDSGVGLSADELNKVFNMFSQIGRSLELSQGGLGIGLSLVRHLVGMHGGSASASSGGTNAGSTFTVRLPLAAAADSSGLAGSDGSTHPDAASPPHGALRVMVVDDNADAALTLAMIIEASGHQAEVANGGAEAVGRIEAFRPDLMFIDIGMPGMNGYETAQAIRALAQHADTYLIALTGWGTEEDRKRSVDAGFNRHLTKPVQLLTVQQILAEFGQALGR